MVGVEYKQDGKSFKSYHEANEYKLKHKCPGKVTYDAHGKAGQRYYIALPVFSIEQSFQKRKDRAQRRYYNMLTRIVKKIKQICNHVSTPSKMVTEVNKYVKSPQFEKQITESVSSMVKGTYQAQNATWREAAQNSTLGQTIYEGLRQETQGTKQGDMIKDILNRNAEMITTATQEVSQKMVDYINEQATKGLRADDMMAQLRKMAPQLTDAQLKRIARTQTAKAHSALQQARCQRLGIDWYKWSSCQDERVRGQLSATNKRKGGHAAMHGIYCRWSDPPNPEVLFPYDGCTDSGAGYHPGNIYNCRCLALPLVSESSIEFPAKFHVHGKIVTCRTIEQFKRL